MAFKQEHLDDLKRLYPDDREIQGLTLQQVNTEGRRVDTSKFHESSAEQGWSVSACDEAVGYVIYDVILLAIGLIGLRNKVRAHMIADIAEAARPVLPRIRVFVNKIAEPGSSHPNLVRAEAAFEILMELRPVIKKVLKALSSNLKGWDRVLFLLAVSADIFALFATDGAAMAAEVAIHLVSFAYLATDAEKAVKACSPKPA